MRARIRDTEIYFDVEGAGLVPDGARMKEKPVAFVIHGGPGVDHTSFKPTFSPLSQKLQLVYFDHRGQGRSARGPKESYTLENNVEDMEALRQHLGLDKIVVIGASYGGMVALTYASRYPEYVSHLIAIVTVPDARFLERAKQILAERGTEEQQAIAQHLWDGTFRDEEHLREYFQILGPMYSLTFDPAAPQNSWKRAILSADAINEAFGGFLRAYDVRDQLHKITAPTLVIGARHDWICPPEFSEEIAALIPNSDLRIFENSGHGVRADEPEALLDAIAGFIVYKR
ncbi:alpha/beta fold hydrolase [Leptodesmis sichuanensis]|uniref:alpha/beta fold hydrolase n=1 Tax=Leptodesmis sichuanensis TaxID=2906798 RepID=UPI001F440D8D|nr:alpha/beta fold hydrolase [Leptodesmis sichuanensis]UIE37534.1 alpha/beta fold hydrolase [Leptodesmis sichuanensis A121]